MIVYVTGCCGGIGKEIVKKYISKRYTVIGIDIDNKSLDELCLEFGHLFYPCIIDLSKKKETRDGLKKVINQYGVPDIFVHCAGIVSLEPFDQETEKKFYQVMEINFLSFKRIIDSLLPSMKEKGGVIVPVSSVAGHVSAPLLASYSASKAALISYVEVMQKELSLKESKVNICLVCPGFIDTPLIRLGEDEGFPEYLRPLLSRPEKVANEIILAIEKKKTYVDPTINGKVLTFLDRLSPKTVSKLSKKALSKGMRKLFKS